VIYILLAFGIGFIIIITVVITDSVWTKRKKKAVQGLLPKLLNRHDWVAGRDLRIKLKGNGVSLNYVSFYSIMNELKRAGKVECRENFDESGRLLLFRLPRAVS
jgi:hypothetical protein